MATRPTLIKAGLTFTKHGYALRRLSRHDPDLQMVRAPGDWLRLEAHLDRLKGGDFDTAAGLLDLVRATADWRLKTIAIKVLGHCASVSVFKTMRQEIENFKPNSKGFFNEMDVEITLAYCAAFASWGRLDVVPVILERYLVLKQASAYGIEGLPLRMSKLLEPELGTLVSGEPPEDMLDEYLTIVLQKYEELARKLGSDKVIVYGGATRSIAQIASSLVNLPSQYLNNTVRELREMFEPATGMDCTAMFVEGKGAQPLAAAVLAQNFLDTREADNFLPGQRYFFGHPVPD